MGQILPFCMLLICGILLILISNFDVTFTNLRKIQTQKKIDAIALDYATSYARALNGIAATNEGLKIAAHRGYLMALAATALAVSAQIPYSPTKIWWEILRPKLPKFYERLNKLGKALVKQQDQMIDWMIESRCSNSLFSRLELNDFYIYPPLPCRRNGFEGLPFYRPDETYGEKIDGVKDCKTRHLRSFNDFHTEMENQYSKRIVKVPSITVEYISNEKKKHFERPKTYEEAQKLTPTYLTYHFINADIETCTKFTDLFKSLSHSIPGIFNIPAPLIFKPEFFEEKNRLIVMESEKINSPFKIMRTEDFDTPVSKLWAISEVKIEGQDFQKMEFVPKLHAISLQEKLWAFIRIKNPIKVLPPLTLVNNEIAH